MSKSSPPEPLIIDVRPAIAAGEAPLPMILGAVHQLAPRQTLRLHAPFEPAPLYQLLGREGFDHHAEEQTDGSWLIEFTPRETS